MKNRRLFILALFSLIPSCLYSQATVALGEKKVPIVIYSPFNFYEHLMDALQCTSKQDYYVVTADKIYVYDNRIGPEYYQGEYRDRELREAKVLNISDFKSTILSNDSCFFFSPTFSRKFDNNFLGIKRGQSLSFVDKNGVKYASLEELLLKAYNTESLDAFFDVYLSEVKNALYHRGTHNMLYEISDKDMAISILKNNYDFIYFNNQNVDLAVDNFLKYLHSIIDVNEVVSKKLKRELNDFFVGQPEAKPFNRAFRDYVRNNDMGRVYLMLMDVSPILQNNLSSQDYEQFTKKHIINQNKTIAAYNYLAKQYHKDIYQDLIPGWDPIYDMIVQYLTKNVLFAL